MHEGDLLELNRAATISITCNDKYLEYALTRTDHILLTALYLNSMV
jgi:hypothetical protein